MTPDQRSGHRYHLCQGRAGLLNASLSGALEQLPCADLQQVYAGLQLLSALNDMFQNANCTLVIRSPAPWYWRQLRGANFRWGNRSGKTNHRELLRSYPRSIGRVCFDINPGQRVPMFTPALARLVRDDTECLVPQTDAENSCGNRMPGLVICG
jgi:hypothetical protein